ncbi:MAG TPA: formamidopyrimidine-DNA glycosylase [Firmicutes bacterium]|jgi:formamidopyrimidine-DNA glycosylase|nr:formamidopyrimidine-DNA glycosylase [Bacillota bacterium]
MPELPEVETVRRSLVPIILDKPIESVDVYYERILQHITVREFRKQTIGRSILDLIRRGKYLIFQFENHLDLVAHLRMTGRLIYYSDAGIAMAKHTSAVFGFGSGGELRFEDVRKFGTLDLVPSGEYEQIKGLHSLGVEPLSEAFSVEHLQDLIENRSTKIKGLLLDQTKIAGLGNIYADESLFMAKIHPERPASSLGREEVKRLHRAIKEVLQDAILGQGTTLRDYRTGYGREGSFQNKLQIYGKKGEKCPRCGVDLEYKKVAGRTSHFCPGCQRE